MYDTSTCGNFPTQENGVGFYHKQHRALALFTVASLFGDQIPGFNLILRSRDNMQI